MPNATPDYPADDWVSAEQSEDAGAGHGSIALLPGELLNLNQPRHEKGMLLGDEGIAQKYKEGDFRIVTERLDIKYLKFRTLWQAMTGYSTLTSNGVT